MAKSHSAGSKWYHRYEEARHTSFPARRCGQGHSSPSLPLHRPRRLALGSLNPLAVNYAKAFAEDKFFGTVARDGFGGSAADVGADESGLLEGNPHNLLHLAIGGSISPDANPEKSGLMAVVQTAAFDPVFWVHHCNIDRLWNVWDSMPGRNWGFSPGPASHGTSGDLRPGHGWMLHG
jgi:tyrosinase